MKFLKTVSTIIALSGVAALVACSSGSSSTGGGGGGNPITVALSGAPTTLVTNATASITATVTNDSANAGVTWSCAPSGSCGTFNPTSTGSGTATTYTAPAAAASVTITATSVTDGTKSATATVSVTAPPIALAAGNYIFSLSGSNTNGAGYNAAGIITVDSTGKITGGEQDFVDSVNSDLHDEIQGDPASTFTTTADGNLQLTITTCLVQDCTQSDTVIGGGTGVETLNGSIVTSSTCGTAGGPCTAKIIEFDSFATSSGALELQDATAASTAPAGGYAFAVQGVPSLSDAVGGILNVSGTTVSTTGTVIDLNLGGVITAAEPITAGSVTAPDPTGRFQISLTSAAATLNFAAYIVDASHVQLVSAAFPLGGVAYSQTTPTAAGNTYTVGLTGADGIGPLQAAGALTLASSGTGVTGTVSYNDLANLQSAAVAVTGTYTADVSNPGRYTLNSVTDGTNTFDLALYVDGNGNALMVSLTSGVVLEGTGKQQTSVSGLSGSYVFSATGFDGSNAPLELDAVGPVTTGSGTFSGFADLNYLGTATPDVSVSGAFTTPNASGVSTGSGNTITGLDVLLGASQADAFDYYVLDSNTVIGVEVDLNQNTLATFDLTQ